MAWDPLDVDFGVWSGVEDGLEVVDNLEGEMLSWNWVWFCTSSYGCLVVDKYPDGTGLVAIHTQHPHSEALWNLGKHVEVYDTELFGILQATILARDWIEANPSTNTIWIFVDNQAAIRRCTKPHPTLGQHLSLQIVNNQLTILNSRPNTKGNIHWVPGHTAVYGNEIADKCAKQAAELTQHSRQSFTSVTYL